MTDATPKRPAADRRAAQQIHDKAIALGATCTPMSKAEGKAVALRGLRKLKPQIKALVTDEQARAAFFAAADEAMDICDACQVLYGLAGLMQGEAYDDEANTVRQLVDVARGLLAFIGGELDEIVGAVAVTSVTDDEKTESYEDEQIAVAGTVKRVAPGSYTVKGPGIIYGGKDIVGDTFTKETDLGLTRSFVGMPVYYDHAQTGVKSQIGTVTAYEEKDDAIDFEIELDKNKKYIDHVLNLVDKGAMGLSTGALPHLVVRKSGQLKRWIAGEISLTPTPAEPRTLGVSRVTITTKRQEAQPEALSGGSAAKSGEPTIIIVTGATKQ